MTFFSCATCPGPNGNILGYNDSVMGTWSFSYDPLNRLTGASVSEGHYQGLNIAWGIDPFGNRTGEVYSGNPTAPMTTPVNWVNYDANNRVLNSSQVPAGYQHDLAGDMTFDGANTRVAHTTRFSLCGFNTVRFRPPDRPITRWLDRLLTLRTSLEMSSPFSPSFSAKAGWPTLTTQ